MYRALTYQEGWKPRQLGKKELGGILGTAFAAGMAHYHQHHVGPLNPKTAYAEELVKSAVAVAGQRLILAKHEVSSQGFIVPDFLQAQYAALESRVVRGVTKAIENNPIPPEWSLRDTTEFTIPGSGNSRIDAAFDTPEGPYTPYIIDYKTKLTLDKKYRQKKIAGYARSWQMYHYCFFYGQHIGQPVDRYGIVLVVLEPQFSIELIPYTINPESMVQWHEFAVATWREMAEIDEGLRIPRGQMKCSDEYGPCAMTRACWSFHYDENLMERDYVRRPHADKS